MISKWVKFVSLTSWIILTRVIDVYATFQFTPDLSKEANPLVSVLGLNSWTVLLGIISVLVLGVIWLYHTHVFKKDLPLPDKSGLNFSNFAGFLYFGEERPWYQMLYRMPKGRKRNIQVIAVILPYGLAFAGLISTLMWYGIYFLPDFYRPYHNVAVIWSIIGLGCIGSWLVFASVEYQSYLKKSKSAHA